jgi:hypothetical protein
MSPHNKKDHRQKIDDGLAFDRTAGIKIRIVGCATQTAGGYSPSELEIFYTEYIRKTL